MPSGWIAEQISCLNPGRVTSAVRVPPPRVSFASMSSVLQPALASVTAADRPFGPAPTTTASYSYVPGFDMVGRIFPQAEVRA